METAHPKSLAFRLGTDIKFRFKFKFIYSHLFNYNTTTIREKNRANYIH